MAESWLTQDRQTVYVLILDLELSKDLLAESEKWNVARSDLMKQ